jgi:cytochrome c peroxidase
MDNVDTPSLIGLAASAPYYHDGSAATLEALLADRGLVHGMADASELSDAQIADLVAYLETL